MNVSPTSISPFIWQFFQQGLHNTTDIFVHTPCDGCLKSAEREQLSWTPQLCDTEDGYHWVPTRLARGYQNFKLQTEKIWCHKFWRRKRKERSLESTSLFPGGCFQTECGTPRRFSIVSVTMKKNGSESQWRRPKRNGESQCNLQEEALQEFYLVRWIAPQARVAP